MKKPLFTNVCTAMVTPFLDGKINYPMMEILLRRQMDAGIQAVVISGTTGESATLSDSEKTELFRHCKEYVGERMLIIAGTGSNNTSHAVELSQQAQKVGADALLIVSPYYNKATPEGLIAHFTAIAHNVDIPIIVYNVPSRTGLDIPVSVYQALSEIPGVAGVKEASTSITKISQIHQRCGKDLPVWSGNDDMTVPIMSLGGWGVISVISNVFPNITQSMTQAALDGDFDTAAALHNRLLPVMEQLFSQVNPIPVKAAMKLIGYDCGDCRLPLTSLSHEHLEMLKNVIFNFQRRKI